MPMPVYDDPHCVTIRHVPGNHEPTQHVAARALVRAAGARRGCGMRNPKSCGHSVSSRSRARWGDEILSAIFGILRFDGGEVSSRELERMSNTLAHRGPDGRKFVVDGQIGLGHGLMRVNTEDLFEAQPLHDREAGLTLVADCRIDNREELAEAFGLSAADIRDMPDSAFILAAYRKWGEDCAEHLLGDFAFAVWDSRAKKLVLARDHMGQRYVHYHHGKDFFAFATEIKALWAVPGVPRQLSEAKFGQWLMRARTASNGETFFETIYGVPGATVMRIGRDGTTDQRRYWEPHADPVHLGRDEAYYIAAYRRVLGEAVACRIGRVVRTPGIIFSGGYDSAGIAALSGPVLAGSGRRLIAAASVMPAGYRGTIRHARPWVEMCARDMPHLDVRYVTRENKSILSGLERGFADTGQPNDAYYFVRHELLSALADGGAKVVMDGHGGDYTLNPRGQAILAHLLVTRQFGRFAAEVRDYRRQTRALLVAHAQIRCRRLSCAALVGGTLAADARRCATTMGGSADRAGLCGAVDCRRRGRPEAIARRRHGRTLPCGINA